MSTRFFTPWPLLSLRLRLGLGAALLSACAIVAAVIFYQGMTDVAERLDRAVAAERRMAHYATLSTQVSTFLVIATEAVQTGLPRDERMARIEPVAATLDRAFDTLRDSLTRAMEENAILGPDMQARFGTQSLGLARMEALLERTLVGLAEDNPDPTRQRAFLDSFSSVFDPLLSQAVNTEVIFRNQTLAGIQSLRLRLTTAALVIAGLAVLGVLSFYVLLVRPLFRRLDLLRDAARRIGNEDFALSLPEGNRDEIDLLNRETARTARALADRKAAVTREWARLNDTIAHRTAELRDANARLSEVDENRRRFFADVSHELRTPLTVILMEAQIGRQTGGATSDAFATIETRAARLNRRIDDLLRVARSDSGQLALDPQPVVLSRLLDEVRDEVKAETDSAGMVLTVDAATDATLVCDPNWTRQIVTGLVRNAIRHARSGGAVRIASEHTADAIGLTVTDNGPGIAPDQQDRLFDRFAQNSPSQAEGFGIGLALARWVVEEQGGTIALTSPVPADIGLGKAPGTKVTLRWPRNKD